MACVKKTTADQVNNKSISVERIAEVVMKALHTPQCRLVQPFLYASHGRLSSHNRSPRSLLRGAVQDSHAQSLRAGRVRTQRWTLVAMATAAPEDVIDVEGTVVDNRIPVTVRYNTFHSLKSLYVHYFTWTARSRDICHTDHHWLLGIRQDYPAECTAQTRSWKAHSSHRKRGAATYSSPHYAHQLTWQRYSYQSSCSPSAPSVHAYGVQFGEIDIDSELVAYKESVDGGETQIMMLNNGCLCCTLNEDLVNMLFELVRQPFPP